MEQVLSEEESNIEISDPPISIDELYDEQTLSEDEEIMIHNQRNARCFDAYHKVLARIEGIREKLLNVCEQDHYWDDVMAIADSLITIETTVEEEIEVKREIQKAELIRERIMTATEQLENRLRLKNAELLGIRLAKQRIMDLLTKDTEFTYKGINLGQTRVSEILIDLPTEEQTSAQERAIEKLKEFYYEDIRQKKGKIQTQDAEIFKSNKVKKELQKKSQEINEKKHIIQKDENERISNERMKNIKEYVEQLRRYIKKSKDRIIVPSKIEHGLISQ